MSETIKSMEPSNSEKIINFNRETGVPPFDPEAAKLAREKRIAEYKLEHPDAVEDIDKAFAMAKAGDKYETEAAKLRAQGNYDEAKVVQKIANTVEEAAGEYYDKNNAKPSRRQKAS